MEKFWILESFYDFLTGMGVSQGTSDVLTFMLACAILAVLVWVMNFVGVRIALISIKRMTSRTKTMWDDYLFRRKFFHRGVRLIPAIIVLYFIGVIFKGYDVSVIESVKVLMNCVITLLFAATVTSFLYAANDVYEYKSTREKSMKGFVQAANIFVYIVAIVIAIAMILKKDPSSIFVGLGASAAVVTLVFKDTILGFVASIQLSAQDMVRLGDWISMPARNADGVVLDITVSTVKVQNWDNTITMVPIYSMVSESFTNWRSMQEGEGRRFTRQLYVDAYSLAILTHDRFREISDNEYIKPLSEVMTSLFDTTNTSTFATNLGLYRCYIEAYVRNHPDINNSSPLNIKYLPQTDNGIKIEIYAFSLIKEMPGFEKTVSDIFEHIMAVAPVFGIRLYQRPSGV